MKTFLNKNKILILILFLALILRLGYIFILDAPLDWNDCKTFHIAAENIFQGKGYSIDGLTPFIAREPGYSVFFLVPLYLITGSSIFMAQLLNIVLSLLMIWLIYKIGDKYFSKKIGLIAGFLFAIYPPLIAYSGELMAAIPFAFLVLLGVYLIIQSIEKKSKKIVFLGGLVLGMAILTKSVATFLPIFLVPFLFIGLNKNYKETLKYFLLICLGTLILITPYTIRNYFAFGEFIYNRNDSGLNLWGGSYIPWKGEFQGNDAPPVPELTQGLDDKAADKKLRELAIQNIKENPLGVLRIWLKKPGIMFFKPEFKAILGEENKLAEFSKEKILNPDFVKKILLITNILITLS